MGKGPGYLRDDGRWCAQIRVNGKRQTVYAQTQKQLKEKLAELRTKGKPEPSGTLADFLVTWLAGRRLTVRVSTARQYADAVNLHLIPDLGKTKLDELNSTQLQEYVAALHSAGYKPNTVRYVMITLAVALNSARQMKVISSDPMDGVRIPPYQRREFAAIPPAEVERLLACAAEHRHGMVVALLIGTGLRIGEALALHWDDVDLASRRIRVNQTVQTVSRQVVVGPPKTKNSRRTVTLPAFLVEILRQHRGRQAELRRELTSWPGGDLVCTGSKGLMLQPSNVRRYLREILAAAGLPMMRLHDLRHAHAALLIAQGTPLLLVSRRLGHASVSITGDLYGHLLPGLDAEAAEQLNASLASDGATGTPVIDLKRRGR